MNWFSFVSRYYAAKYYDKDDVRVFVEAGKLTPEQYEAIVGEPYLLPEAPPEAPVE